MASESSTPIRYADSGVNYALMDPFKIACQRAGLLTAKNIERFAEQGVLIREVTWSRGESAYQTDLEFLRDGVPIRLAIVDEGVGSKDTAAKEARKEKSKLRLADEVSKVLGISLVRNPAFDNVSTGLNDASSTGTSPIAYMHFIAVGDGKWFKDEVRYSELIEGTVEACNYARCAWGGGETQTLVGKIYKDECVMAGAVLGISFPGNISRLPSEMNIEPGLKIVLLLTDSLQTNGLTPVRRNYRDIIAERMGLSGRRKYEAYTYDIGNGQTYGEAVLKRSEIATPVIDGLLLGPNPTPVEYASHISGHAWGKIMRATPEYSYVFDKIPEPAPIFRLLQDVSGMDDMDMYTTYNMGAYFALFVKPENVSKVQEVAELHGQKALDAGYIESGPKKIVIRPLDLEIPPEYLQIR